MNQHFNHSLIARTTSRPASRQGTGSLVVAYKQEWDAAALREITMGQ